MEWVAFVPALIVVAIVTIGLILWRAAICGAGWRAWVCYQIAHLHGLLITRCSATNACTYPEHGPAIIVANHSSPLDPMLLWFRHYSLFRVPRLRVIGFLTAKEYCVRRGIVGWVCRSMQSIPVERSGHDMAPLRAALRRLQAGHLVGIFPEGRLNVTSPDEQLLPGGTGVAWLAMRSGAPVIPVFIRNSPRAESMVRAFFTRTRSTRTFGQPIEFSRGVDKKPDHRELTENAGLIMQRLAELGGIRPAVTTDRPNTE